MSGVAVRILRSRGMLVLSSLLLCLLGLELFSSAIYSYYLRSPVSPGDEASVQFKPEELRASQEQMPNYVVDSNLHPYLGFTLHNGNKWGFPGPEIPSQKKENELHVVVTGGSVALHFAKFQYDEKQIQKLFPDKQVKVFSLAIPGYKQPQQLFALNYMLTRGAKIDILINLDGFNEVALPYAENIPYKVHPSFPRSWYFHAQNAMNESLTLALGEIYVARKRRSQLKAWLQGSAMQRSAFVLTLSTLLDRHLVKKVQVLEEQFKEDLAELKIPRHLFGPEASYEEQGMLWGALASLWKQASLQMHYLARANGILYLHFLQPNQWLSGSKPFSPEEERLWEGPVPEGYRFAVEHGYETFIREGENLKALGVAYEDLTMAFASEPRSLYYDACCHFNSLGNEIISRKILAAILRHYDRRPEQPGRTKATG